MKRFSFLLLVLGALFLPIGARAEELIHSFDVEATIHPNRLVEVRERITYDFGDEEKHGIFRFIPVIYNRHGSTYHLRLQNVSVTMDGQDVPFDVSSPGDTMHIKIGDPEATIRGAHTYIISYQTDRAINFFESSSEFYWNITGNDWPVMIESASLSVRGPASPSRTVCFTGTRGSQDQECIIEESLGAVRVRVNSPLYPYQGLTAVVEFPAGIILPLTSQEQYLQFARDNWGIVLPFAALLVMGGLWWVLGRDPRMGSVIPIYEPPEGLRPAEIGTIYRDGAFSARLMTATLLDLARRGYFSLRYGINKGLLRDKQTFAFIKSQERPSNDELVSYEQHIYKALFKEGEETKLEDLRTSRFFEPVQKTKKDLEADIKKRKIFVRRPALIRAVFIWIAGTIAALSVFVFGYYIVNMIAGLLTAAIIGIVGWWMPRRTPYGTKLLAEIKGFEWFLRVTEKDRLAFHNAPERTPEEFHRLLPYAIVLGVEDEWAKQFEGIDMEPPAWMTGYASHRMPALALASAMNAFQGQVSHSLGAYTTQAGSGGSGFSGGGGSSGGGFGGGGGGSW